MLNSRTTVASVITCVTILLAPYTFVNHATADNASNGYKTANERRCLLCHNPSGVNDHPKAPYLAGQKKEYLIQQLNRFRNLKPAKSDMKKIAERHHYFMDKHIQTMTPKELNLISEYFSNFKCIPIRSNAVKQLLAPAKTKSCAFCHGQYGVNPYNAYPNIAGQKKIYLIEQLMAFRDSALHGSKKTRKDKRFHRTMSPAVIDLSNKEIEDIADYYSKQSCE
jgi:cytochrome c553